MILSTVDSIPNEHYPPSIMNTSESALKSSKTCSALVGDTCPNLLALGAAIGS